MQTDHQHQLGAVHKLQMIVALLHGFSRRSSLLSFRILVMVGALERLQEFVQSYLQPHLTPGSEIF